MNGQQPLRNVKHEQFAQLMSQGVYLVDAYAQTGYKRDPGHARRLARNGLVRDRIDYLQAKCAAAAEVTLESLIADAQRIMMKAERLDQLGPAVGALKELGILCGFRVERREQTVKTSPDELTDAELLAIASRGRPLLEHAPADTAETASAILPAQDVEDAA